MNAANRYVHGPKLIHGPHVAIAERGIERLIGEDERVMIGHAISSKLRSVFLQAEPPFSEGGTDQQVKKQSHGAS